MTLKQFTDKYYGKSIGYPAGEYVGECLSIVKQYIKECYGLNAPASGSGSAYGYWSNFPKPLSTKFRKVANTPSGVPKPGDIIIWKPWKDNQYGHIAIVISANSNAFTSFDQNWGGRTAHTVNHNYNNVVGWLTPKATEDNMAKVAFYKLNSGSTIYGYWRGQRYAYNSWQEYLDDGGASDTSNVKVVSSLPKTDIDGVYAEFDAYKSETTKSIKELNTKFEYLKGEMGTQKLMYEGQLKTQKQNAQQALADQAEAYELQIEKLKKSTGQFNWTDQIAKVAKIVIMWVDIIIKKVRGIK